MFTEPFTLSRATALCHVTDCRCHLSRHGRPVTPLTGLCQDLPLWGFQTEPSSVPGNAVLTRPPALRPRLSGHPLSILMACAARSRPIGLGPVSPTRLVDSLSPRASQPLNKLPVEFRTLRKDRKVRRSRRLARRAATCGFPCRLRCTGHVAGVSPPVPVGGEGRLRAVSILRGPGLTPSSVSQGTLSSWKCETLAEENSDVASASRAAGRVGGTASVGPSVSGKALSWAPGTAAACYI